MTVHVRTPETPAGTELDAFLAIQQDRDVLRFITCGSVDDGKSTLIGRLLHDTKQLFDDQLATLRTDSRRHGTQNGDLDFALLVDGLSAEREQGITIDVAYRFFSTSRRSFIVADTPGHEQYTRNMATGASTADLAILLVDARKGITRQTRRHTLLASMLGIRQIVVAINKMDLVGWSQSVFDRVMADYAAFAAELEFEGVVGIPLSALQGDNITLRSNRADWYKGPALLEHLERVQVGPFRGSGSFRMPVQWVSRPNQNFRGFAGLVTRGLIEVGTPVRVFPSGRETAVARIVSFERDLQRAEAGQSVTLVLRDEVDVSRGDILVGPGEPPMVSDRVEARLFWMAPDAAQPGSTYLLKLGATTVPATVAAVRRRVDLDEMSAVSADALSENDIGDALITLDRAIAYDPYSDSRDTGSFILIDRRSGDTVAMGLALPRDAGAQDSGPVDAHATRKAVSWISSAREKPWRSIAKAVTWRATGSIDTFLLAFLFTHDARISAAIGGTEILTKILLYYGHERIWARIRLGLSKPGGQDSTTS